MKKTIFTLSLAFCSFLGFVKAQDIVSILDFGTQNFTPESLNEKSVEVAQAPDGQTAVKITLDNETQWDGAAIITLNQPVTLGEYVSFEYETYCSIEDYRGYMKPCNENGEAIEGFEGWGEENNGAWVTTTYSLLITQADGGQTRRTGELGSFIIMALKDWSNDGTDLEGKEIYYRNFRLVKGDDVPPPADNEPVAYYNSYISEYAIRIDGLDSDNSWDVAIDNGFSTAPLAGSTLSGYFYSTWDAQKFYLFAEVTDGNQVIGVGDPGFVSWMGDGIQLYFDIYDRHYETLLPTQINGVAFSPKMTTDDFYEEQSGLFDGYANGVEIGSTVVGSKYTLEIGIPWHAFYKVAGLSGAEIEKAIQDEIKPGKKMAIAIRVNDNNGTERIASITAPAVDGDSHGDPSLWARITLEGEGTPFYDPDYSPGITGINNPVMGNVYVFPILDFIKVIGENLKSVEVYNIAGQKLSATPVTGEETLIPSSDLAKGIYLVKVTDQNKNIITKKIIK